MRIPEDYKTIESDFYDPPDSMHLLASNVQADIFAGGFFREYCQACCYLFFYE